MTSANTCSMSRRDHLARLLIGALSTTVAPPKRKAASPRDVATEFTALARRQALRIAFSHMNPFVCLRGLGLCSLHFILCSLKTPAISHLSPDFVCLHFLEKPSRSPKSPLLTLSAEALDFTLFTVPKPLNNCPLGNLKPLKSPVIPHIPLNSSSPIRQRFSFLPFSLLSLNPPLISRDLHLFPALPRNSRVPEKCAPVRYLLLPLTAPTLPCQPCAPK